MKILSDQGLCSIYNKVKSCYIVKFNMSLDFHKGLDIHLLSPCQELSRFLCKQSKLCLVNKRLALVFSRRNTRRQRSQVNFNLPDHVKRTAWSTRSQYTLSTSLYKPQSFAADNTYIPMASLLQETLYEIQCQAPAPSKDFHHFVITKKEVRALLNFIVCINQLQYWINLQQAVLPIMAIRYFVAMK